jgi:hypothetical protein
MRPFIHARTIDLIVEEYEKCASHRDEQSEWWKADGLSFEELLTRVGMAESKSGRHPHQRRLEKSALEQGTTALRSVKNRIKSANDFYVLWRIIQERFKSIKGLGELATYDAADRLRHRLNLESEHIIYLHAGTRVGARRLFGGRLPREIGWGLQRDDVPFGLRHLSTHEIEDILCHYKDELLLTPDEFVKRRGMLGPFC